MTTPPEPPKVSSDSQKRRRWPFVQGDLVEGEVLRLAPRGGAIALIGGVEVRVAGGVPGDEGVFRITRTGKNAAWGAIIELQKPSMDRVEAPCPVVDRCGGCAWQRASVDLQRWVRLAAIEESLGDLLGESVTRHPWIGPAEMTGYRTRALMMTRHLAGKLRLGFYAPGSHHLVAAEGCVVQDPGVNRAMEAVQTLLQRAGISTYRDPERAGLLRAVLIRIDPEVGAGLVTLVVSEDDERLRGLAESLCEFPEIIGVFANENAETGGAVLGERTWHLAGKTRQEIRYAGLSLEVGPTAFLQTNHQVGVSLVETVTSLVPESIQHLVDVYSGIGVFGLALSDRADKVTLIERDAHAVEDAEHNIERLGATHVSAISAIAADGLKQIASEAPDVVILDPPRSGCAPEVLETLCALKGALTVVYVSCGLPSLRRDLGVLVDAGFTLTDLVALDMFPHTPHQELVVALERKK